MGAGREDGTTGKDRLSKRTQARSMVGLRWESIGTETVKEPGEAGLFDRRDFPSSWKAFLDSRGRGS